MSVQQRISQIHAKVDSRLSEFQKTQNTKSLQNQIQKCFKQVRQLLSNSEGSESLNKSMIQKQQKTKYILECKKGLQTKEAREQNLKKINAEIQKINKKISDFQKNVTSQNKQNNKRKKNNYEKNIQFLRYHIGKLEVIRENLGGNKLYLVENIKALFEYLGDIFVSHEDTIFQEDIEKCYDTMFVLADIKESEIGNALNPKSTKTNDPPAPVSPAVKVPQSSPKKEAVVAKQNAVTQDQIQTKQHVLNLISQSYNTLPRWNDYIPLKPNQPKKARKILPTYKNIDLSVISKMKDDVLFIIFYSAKGENEQYFAAKELKKRHWRYNTKYLNWFRRYGEPTVEMADHEVADYVFFDYGKFINRKKTGFIMKFHQLEDKI